LLGDLLYASRHAGIIAPAIVARQSGDSPHNCSGSANDCDQQLAANRLAMPHDSVASLLHRLVRRARQHAIHQDYPELIAYRRSAKCCAPAIR
jgi:hypothetical protein